MNNDDSIEQDGWADFGALTRSPSEAYVKYALLRTPDVSPVQVVAALEPWGVILPRQRLGYVRHLSSELRRRMPQPFEPWNLRHGASQEFLQEQGLWQLWHPDPTVRQAFGIFRSPVLREQVTALLAARFVPEQVALFLQSRFGKGVDEATIQAYEQAYWDTKALLPDERDALYQHPQLSSIVQDAHLAGRHMMGRIGILIRMDFKPDLTDDRRMSEWLREAIFVMASDPTRPGALRLAVHYAGMLRSITRAAGTHQQVSPTVPPVKVPEAPSVGASEPPSAGVPATSPVGGPAVPWGEKPTPVPPRPVPSPPAPMPDVPNQNQPERQAADGNSPSPPVVFDPASAWWLRSGQDPTPPS